jgi:hypothetical protein
VKEGYEEKKKRMMRWRARKSERAKMVLTRDDEQVDIVAEAAANAPITP